MDRTAITNRVLADMLGEDVLVAEKSNPVAVEAGNQMLGMWFDRLHLDSPDLALTEEEVESRLRGELSGFLVKSSDGLRKALKHPALKHERLTTHDEFDGVKLTLGTGTLTVRDQDLDALEEVVELLKKERGASKKAGKSTGSKKVAKSAHAKSVKKTSTSKGSKSVGTSPATKSTGATPSVTKSSLSK